MKRSIIDYQNAFHQVSALNIPKFQFVLFRHLLLSTAVLIGLMQYAVV